jgi:hypothetical protein
LASAGAEVGAELFLSTDEITDKVQHGITSFGHMSLPMLLEKGLVESEYFHNAFKFAFVRNPFDRAVSLFEFLKMRRNLPQATTFPIFCEFIRHRAYEPIGLYNRTQLSQLNTQCTWLKDSEGKTLCDFVGRFENLEADFESIRRQLGDRVTLPALGHFRKSERSMTTTYYTPAEVRIIQEAYREDFESFDYSMDLRPPCSEV